MRRKLVAALLLSSVMMAGTARADEAELLARIETLEQRVAQLEQMMGIGEAPATETEAAQETSTETISLGTGTWIVGEDLPEGKYNITCASGMGSLYFYNSLDERKEDIYNAYEMHLMCGDDVREEMLASPYEMDTVMSVYSTTLNNVSFDDGNCIYSELQEIILTPVQ